MEGTAEFTHVFIPTPDQHRFMEACGMVWVHRHQRFDAGDWDWQAQVGVCPDGLWKARYTYDDGQVGMHGRTWEGNKHADPIACYIEAKLANWGN